MKSSAVITAEVDELVRDSISVSELTVKLSHMLGQLRRIYINDKTEFSPDQIHRLKFAARLPILVANFMEALEESKYVTHKEDAEELVSRFAQLEIELDGCKFRLRAAKERRELLERHRVLPARWKTEEEQFQRELEIRVHRLAPSCTLCGTRLRLRQSMYGLFWGCQNFPKCFGKQRLTVEQAKLLRDDA